MSQVETTTNETSTGTQPKTPVEAKAEAKKSAKAGNGKDTKTKARKAPKKQAGFEFTGRVEGINIKGTDTAGSQFLFSLVSKKGEHRSFVLDSANASRFAAMSSLLSAAYAKGAKVHLNTAPSNGPTPFAGEIEVRAKA